jgi:hypothetical protein
MTGEPLHRVVQGQPLEIRAETWNQVLEMAYAARQKRLGVAGDPTVDNGIVPADMVMVYQPPNTSNLGIGQWAVLTYQGPAVDPALDQNAVQRRPAVTGAVPQTTADQVCITVEPILAGGFGRAVCSGAAVVMLQVCPAYSSVPGWACPVAGESGFMQTCGAGGYPLIAIGGPAGGGLNWGIVLLGATRGVAVGTCGPGSSSSSSGSSSSGSESTSPGSTAEVVTDVECSSGGLSVTKGTLSVSVTIGGITFPCAVTINTD